MNAESIQFGYLLMRFLNKISSVVVLFFPNSILVIGGFLFYRDGF